MGRPAGEADGEVDGEAGRGGRQEVLQPQQPGLHSASRHPCLSDGQHCPPAAVGLPAREPEDRDGVSSYLGEGSTTLKGRDGF